MESIKRAKEEIFKNKNATLYSDIKGVLVEIEKKKDSSRLVIDLDAYENKDQEILISHLKELIGLKWIVPTDTEDKGSSSPNRVRFMSNNGPIEAVVSGRGYGQIILSDLDINAPLANVEYRHIYHLLQRNWMDEISSDTRILRDVSLYKESDFTLYKKYECRQFKGIHAVVDSSNVNNVASPITLIERLMKILTKDKLTRSGISYNRIDGGLLYFVKYKNSERKEILITLLLPNDTFQQNVSLEISKKYLEMDLLSNIDLDELGKDI